MGTYPRDRQSFLNWCESHAPLWTENAVALGLSAEQAGAFASATTALRTRITNQTGARDAAKAATEAVVEAESALRGVANELVKAIRLHAVSTGDKDVYAIAQIPPPAAPAPVPPPGMPDTFRVELNAAGGFTLRWRAHNPPGAGSVVYLVHRKLAGESGFTLVAATGEKRYEESALPLGVESVIYTVTPKRGQITGQRSNPLAIVFGAPGAGGLRIASITEGGQRLAA